MAKKMLGKVVAGAALGGASLLVFAPGVAYADGQPHEDEGKVFAKPHAVKPGEEVKLVEICAEPQKEAFVWSKVTGKVKLEPARDGREWGADRESWSGEKGFDEHGKDWKGDEERGEWAPGEEYDERRAPEEGREEYDERRAPEEGKSGPEAREEEAKPEPKGGAGGGAAADGDRDWKGEEHGQDPEGREYTERKGDERGEHREKTDREGYERGEHDEWTGGEGYEHGQYDSKSGREGYEFGEKSGHEGEWWAERGEKSAEHPESDSWEHKKDFVYYGEARVAEHAEPGTYKLEGSCGEGELVVLPRGGVRAGDGGAANDVDRGLATAGVSLVGAAALGGLVLLRRRRADEFAA